VPSRAADAHRMKIALTECVIPASAICHEIVNSTENAGFQGCW
jgi:hypothetical protein